MSSFEINLTDKQIMVNRKQTKKAMDFYRLLWKSAELVHGYVGQKPSLPNAMLDKLNTRIEEFKGKYHLHRAEEGALIGMALNYLLYGSNKDRSVDTPQLHTADPYTSLDKRIIHPDPNQSQKEYLQALRKATRLLRRYDGRQLAELLTEVDKVVKEDRIKVWKQESLQKVIKRLDRAGIVRTTDHVSEPEHLSE